MSFADLAGAKVDVAGLRQPVLLPAEQLYVAGRRGRQRHLAILHLRVSCDYTFQQIADSVGVTRGHVCRITRRVKKELEKISREIFSGVGKLR